MAEKQWRLGEPPENWRAKRAHERNMMNGQQRFVSNFSQVRFATRPSAPTAGAAPAVQAVAPILVHRKTVAAMLAARANRRFPRWPRVPLQSRVFESVRRETD